jgi:hypothetical protein
MTRHFPIKRLPQGRRRNSLRRIFGPLLLAVVLLWACGGVANRAAEHSRFDADRALEDVATQVARGPRTPGSQASRTNAAWILQELQAAGWETEQQVFEYRGVRLRNLIGRAGPEGPGGILLGTHHDTRPVADRAAAGLTGPVPGANDGASGVAVLLEIARVLPRERLNQPVQLVFFDGEDSGRIDGWPWVLGSTEFVTRGERLPKQAIIVDMVGDADLQLRMEKNSDPALASEIWRLAGELGHSGFIAEPGRKILDDHVPFLQAGIPAIDIIDIDYPFWHTTEDTLDKVSADSLRQVGETLLAWLEATALTP